MSCLSGMRFMFSRLILVTALPLWAATGCGSGGGGSDDAIVVPEAGAESQVKATPSDPTAEIPAPVVPAPSAP